MPKSWRDKHDGHKHPVQIETLEKPFAGFPPGATMVIATPKDMTAYFKSVPRGKTRDVAGLRRHLAAKYKADVACPLTTGIFTRIAAEYAYAQMEEGALADTVAPFWRVIDPASPLAKKLACGADFIRRMRAEEGAPSLAPANTKTKKAPRKKLAPSRAKPPATRKASGARSRKSV